MTNFKSYLLRLNKNLSILQEREAKYGGQAPVALLNQITDHQQAITLTEQAMAGELAEADWQEAMKPLPQLCHRAYFPTKSRRRLHLHPLLLDGILRLADRGTNRVIG